jgi:hypothetical protein
VDDESTEDVIRTFYAQHQHELGTTFFVVEDTKVDAWVIRLELDAVDDPRLQDDEQQGGNT